MYRVQVAVTKGLFFVYDASRSFSVLCSLQFNPVGGVLGSFFYSLQSRFMACGGELLPVRFLFFWGESFFEVFVLHVEYW